MPTMNDEAAKALRRLLVQLEGLLDADVLALVGPIGGELDTYTRIALDRLVTKRAKLAVILDTPGGIVETAERIVDVIRHSYKEVVFIIPDMALSAGTILAMSGDAILMDYFSCLGPIDPQVERDGELVPALSYLVQWDRLVEKSRDDTLTEAEELLVRDLDLAELHQFEMQRDLSISLVRNWLATYKLKDWHITETSRAPVTQAMREARAEEIATKLMRHELWGSHRRGLPMKVLQEELKLKIDDFGADSVLRQKIHDYFQLLTDYQKHNHVEQCVHNRDLLQGAP